jgi:serine/threonine protein kinase
VQPHNIIWNKRTRVVKLADFGVASVVVRARETTSGACTKSSVPVQHVLGSLAYLPPELSPRNPEAGSRPADYRSDFYSLGITFFELLTGSTPFSAERSAVRMMHAHMAKQPPRAHDVDARIPVCVSAVVQRLLAKSVEMRYQSSRGLVADLLCCQALIHKKKQAPHHRRSTGAAAGETGDENEDGESAEEEFEPGKNDVSDVFRFPAKLYGREKEIDMLRELFATAAKSQTKSQVTTTSFPLLLVSPRALCALFFFFSNLSLAVMRSEGGAGGGIFGSGEDIAGQPAEGHQGARVPHQWQVRLQQTRRALFGHRVGLHRYGPSSRLCGALRKEMLWGADLCGCGRGCVRVYVRLSHVDLTSVWARCWRRAKKSWQS